MRTGLVAKKLGMSRFYTDAGVHLPVTLLQVDGCQVVAVRNKDNAGYNAVQLGYGKAKVKNVSKALRGHFAKARVEPTQNLIEFRVSEKCLLSTGDQLSASHFVAGQYVDVAATSIGKGFSGGMKRHNFRGLEASHGVSVSHRSHGSTGQCQDPGRVFKGKKMAGQYGNKRVSIQNLEVISIDNEKGIIIVCGAVPGPKGAYVEVCDAVKRALPASAPYPAALKNAKANNQNVEASAENNADKEEGDAS